MSLDFWNNPLVVSAFRVKYRNRGLFNRTAVYLLMLVSVGAAMQYYQDRLGTPWVRYYYFTIMAVQFFVSIGGASSSTSTSMKQEVANRTLDFQRIAALSPRQILLGKMLGEPTQTYFCALATVPLATWCVLNGGVGLDIMLIVYLNLATTTVLFAAIGLGNRLEPPQGQADIGLAGFAGIFTPFVAAAALRPDDPWQFGIPLPLGGTPRVIPALAVLPFVQLALAYLCFQTMERRLLNPLLPPYSKRLAYVVLILVEGVASAASFATPAPLLGRCLAFCILHFVVCLWLLGAVTPWKETLHSWVWRNNGRRPPLADLALGDRSPNSVVLLFFCAAGAAAYLPMLFAPDPWGDIFIDRWQSSPLIYLEALALTTLLVLALGMFHQRALLMIGRTGAAAALGLLLFLDLPPNLLGMYYQSDLLQSFSPSAHFMRWLKPTQPPLLLAPVIGVYALILVLCWVSLHRRVGQLRRQVTAKLTQMGVLQPAAPGG